MRNRPYITDKDHSLKVGILTFFLPALQDISQEGLVIHPLILNISNGMLFVGLGRYRP